MAQPADTARKGSGARPPTSHSDASVPDHEPGDEVRPREWAWRRRLRERRTTYRFYRLGIALLGVTIIVIGLILVPLPGPGWLIVFLGVGVLASEFPWARRLHTWASAHLRRWNAWILASPWWVRIAVASLTFLFVCACFWVLFKLAGLPVFLPEWATTFLRSHAAL